MMFTGKVAVVTGGSRGIGLAIARALLERGARVAITATSDAALPHLRKRGAGWIINVSSLAGKNAFPEAAAYCASKAGLNAFSEALMQEVRHDGIRVAYVMPGSVRTELSGRTLGHDEWKLAPDDIAEVVTDLIGHPSRSLPSRVEIRPARPPKKG